jgi:hypothetical protein
MERKRKNVRWEVNWQEKGTKHGCKGANCYFILQWPDLVGEGASEVKLQCLQQ